jgi:hypothetical protein
METTKPVSVLAPLLDPLLKPLFSHFLSTKKPYGTDVTYRAEKWQAESGKNSCNHFLFATFLEVTKMVLIVFRKSGKRESGIFGYKFELGLYKPVQQP